MMLPLLFFAPFQQVFISPLSSARAAFPTFTFFVACNQQVSAQTAFTVITFVFVFTQQIYALLSSARAAFAMTMTGTSNIDILFHLFVTRFSITIMSTLVFDCSMSHRRCRLIVFFFLHLFTIN